MPISKLKEFVYGMMSEEKLHKLYEKKEKEIEDINAAETIEIEKIMDEYREELESDGSLSKENIDNLITELKSEHFGKE